MDFDAVVAITGTGKNKLRELLVKEKSIHKACLEKNEKYGRENWEENFKDWDDCLISDDGAKVFILERVDYMPRSLSDIVGDTSKFSLDTLERCFDDLLKSGYIVDVSNDVYGMSKHERHLLKNRYKDM
jgi:hypothetical protein